MKLCLSVVYIAAELYFNGEIHIKRFSSLIRYLLLAILVGHGNDNDDMSRVVRKPDFFLCENKDADQLRGNREADQHLCFRYIDSTVPLLSKYEISSL